MYGPGDVRFFDRLARLYDLVMPPVAVDELIRGLERADRPIDRLLDVAGGTGRGAAALDVPERVVLDSSRGMLSRAREYDVEAVQADAGQLPVRDESADAALLVDAFHHLPDQRAAIDELERVVAPGGVVVIRDFDPSTLLGRGISAGEQVLMMGSSFRTPNELAELLRTAGFDATVQSRGVACTVVGVKPTEGPTDKRRSQ